MYDVIYGTHLVLGSQIYYCGEFGVRMCMQRWMIGITKHCQE